MNVFQAAFINYVHSSKPFELFRSTIYFNNSSDQTLLTFFFLHFRYLNLSGNNLRYLPASFESMKLCEADLTYNLLTSNIRSDFKPEFRDDRKTCMRLVDIAALSIDPVLR